MLAYKKIEIDESNMKSLFPGLYDENGLTIEGLSEESIIDFINYVDKNYGFVHPIPNIYVIKGSTMNTYYQLTDDNRYPSDLTIVVIKNSSIKDMMKCIIDRFSYGGRWFDDVVDNNLRYEQEKAM